jgi:hypothetical protein
MKYTCTFLGGGGDPSLKISLLKYIPTGVPLFHKIVKHGKLSKKSHFNTFYKPRG